VLLPSVQLWRPHTTRGLHADITPTRPAISFAKVDRGLLNDPFAYMVLRQTRLPEVSRRPVQLAPGHNGPFGALIVDLSAPKPDLNSSNARRASPIA